MSKLKLINNRSFDYYPRLRVLFFLFTKRTKKLFEMLTHLLGLLGSTLFSEILPRTRKEYSKTKECGA